MVSREDRGWLADLLEHPNLPGSYVVVSGGVPSVRAWLRRARAYLMFALVAAASFGVAGFWVAISDGTRGWVAILAAVGVLIFASVGDRRLHGSFVSRLTPGSTWLVTGRPSRGLLDAAGIGVPVPSRRWTGVVACDGEWVLAIGTFRGKPRLDFDDYSLYPIQSVEIEISRSGHTLGCTLTAGDQPFDLVINRSARHA